MSLIDLMFLIIAGYGFFIGYTRGIIRTVFTVLSVLFGLLAALKFGPTISKLLKEDLIQSDNPMMFLAGFLIAFLLTMILIRLFARGVEGVLQTVQINVINRFAGGVITAGLFIFVFALLLRFGERSNVLNSRAKTESFTYQFLEAYPDTVWDLFSYTWPVLEDFWDHSVEFMDDLQRIGEESIERRETNEITDLDEEEEN